MPTWLSDIGFTLPLLREGAPEYGVYAYQPRWPLWSNGSEKHRLLVVPRRPDGAYPPAPPQPEALAEGTLFFKTFSYTGPDGQTRPAETRAMRLEAGSWAFYRYEWMGGGALQLNSRAPVPLPARLANGTRFTHEIPSPGECQTCHNSYPGQILGYRTEQLLDAPVIDGDVDDVTRQVMAYVQGNCVPCHNGFDLGEGNFDMHPTVLLENTINRKTQGSGSAIGTRIVPGKPEQSILWLALAGGKLDKKILPMPPVGVQHIDQEAVELFRVWIQDVLPKLVAEDKQPPDDDEEDEEDEEDNEDNDDEEDR